MKINENLDNQINKNLFNPYESSSIYFGNFRVYQNLVGWIRCQCLSIEIERPICLLKYIEFMRNFIEIKIITLNKSFGNDFISYKNFSGKSLEYKNDKIILKNAFTETRYLYDLRYVI